MGDVLEVLAHVHDLVVAEQPDYLSAGGLRLVAEVVEEGLQLQGIGASIKHIPCLHEHDAAAGPLVLWLPRGGGGGGHSCRGPQLVDQVGRTTGPEVQNVLTKHMAEMGLVSSEIEEYRRHKHRNEADACAPESGRLWTTRVGSLVDE